MSWFVVHVDANVRQHAPVITQFCCNEYLVVYVQLV